MSEKPTNYQLREFAYHIDGIDKNLSQMEGVLERIARKDCNLHSQDKQTEINKKLKSLHQKIAKLEIDLRNFNRKEN